MAGLNARRPAALPSRQRGVAAVFTAIAIVAAITAFGLVYDTGQLYFAQRDLQRLANLSALDAAQSVSGCVSGQVTEPLARAESATRASLQRNGGDQAQAWLTEGGVQVGRRTSRNQLRVLDADAAARRPAVQVTLTRPQPGLVMPLLTREAGQGTLVARGAAFAGPDVTLEVGSFALRVSSGDATLLNGVFEGLLGGGSLDLTLGGFQSLVDAEVSIQQLVDAQARVDDARELLETEFRLGDLIQLIGDAVVDTAEPAVLETLRALSDAADPARELVLDDIFAITGDPNAAADGAFVSVGELVNAAAAVANETVPIDLGPLLGMPGAPIVIDTRMVIEDGPRIAISSDASELAGDGGLSASSELLGLDASVSVGNAAASLNFDLDATAIQADAQVVDIICASPGRPFHQVLVDATTRTAEVTVTNLRVDTGLPLVGTLELGGFVLGLANRTDTPLSFGSASDPTFPQTRQARATSDDLSTVVVNGVADALRSELANQLALPGGLPVGLPLAEVTGILEGLLSEVTGPLDDQLRALFDGFGVQAGGADVTVQRVTVDRPVLFTHDV